MNNAAGDPLGHSQPMITEVKRSVAYMNMELINKVVANQIKPNVPDFKSGDTVKVHVKIVEGSKSRIQVFQGAVISIKGSGVAKSFTVRKISNGVGVERVFCVNSPLVDKIEVVKKGDVRRKKLYYLRNRTGKAARV